MLLACGYKIPKGIPLSKSIRPDIKHNASKRELNQFGIMGAIPVFID